jgi:protein O-GlcNAc transferase
MIARNALCPCGSGRKFKQCHGASGVHSAGTGGESYSKGVLAQLQGHTQAALVHYSQAVVEQRQAKRLPALDKPTLEVAAAIQLCETAAGNYPGSPARSEDGMFGSATELQLLESALLEWERGTRPEDWLPETRRVHGNAWYNLGCAALAAFTADDRRIGLFTRAIELDPQHVQARCNLAFSWNYSCSARPSEVFAAHRQVGAWLEARQRPPSLFQPRPPLHGKRIRLGYLSSDFRQHAVAHFILPVLAQHDRQHFEVFVYHNHPREDARTEQARQSAEHFATVARLDDTALANRIAADGIDILIDLNGLTGRHRLEMLAQRVAPVQLSWIGYPNTTGLTNMDFRLVDELTDPPGEAEGLSTETLLRLDAPFLCYQPPAAIPDDSPSPFLENGFITFGSFNALPKLNPDLLRVWASILHEVPDSRLLVKNLGMGFARPRQQVSNILESHGISPERLLFAGKEDAQSDHLQYHARADISLDSFPYHGTTTSCESLLMGVPVVTRASGEHRSRVGLSLLTALGLESLVAKDENSVIRTAVSLANDPDRLQRLRGGLRNRLLVSRLCDVTALTRDLENKLTAITEAWQNNKSRNNREPHEH